MSRFWASWWEPETGDFDCSDDEPTPEERASREVAEAVLWCSGHRWLEDEDQSSIVALIDAPDEDAVRARVEAARTVRAWRFCDKVADDWTPGPRFPMPEPAAT